MDRECPYCQSTDKQYKNGRTGSGSQQYRCGSCGRQYTPEPKAAGYSDEVRHRAVQIYTDSVEGVNADLRHYLARLRRRSRCFSRSLKALITTVKLFVFAHNRRQMYHWRFPAYPAHLMNFLPL